MEKSGKLDGKGILESVIAVTSEAQTNMVHRDEFLDLKAETGEVISEVHELCVFKESFDKKQRDDHFKLMEGLETLSRLNDSYEHSMIDFDKAKAKIETKLDIEIFDEELEHLNNAISQS